MPIPWLSILSNVPWKEVISNAPKVADGAKKLWKVMAKNPDTATGEGPENLQSHAPETQTIETLDLRIRDLKTEISTLNQALSASSEIIKALAEQNTQLIGSIEIFRGRVWRLALVTIISFVTALVALYRTFS